MWYPIYYTAMIKKRAGTGSIIWKAMCLALALITGGSLFATGIMASGGCGMKCCCQTGPMGTHPNAERQMRSSMGCCSNGVPLNPCDLQSAQPNDLPEFIPAASGGFHQVPFGPAVILSDSCSDSGSSSGIITLKFTDQKFKTPPLYLQKHEFLI
jgi:hypothetical protein